jgi:hypothetical protein
LLSHCWEECTSSKAIDRKKTAMTRGAETTYSPEPDAKREWRLNMARAARARAAQMPSADAREAYQRLAEGWEFLAKTTAWTS